MECPPDLKQLSKILYNVSDAEAEVLYFLCGNESRVSNIAEQLGKDRSTVQRYLSKLRTAGLVARESRNEAGKKGRYYVYSVGDKEELKQKLATRLEQWTEDKKEAIQQM